MAKAKKPKIKRSHKFFLGLNPIIRALLKAEAKVDKSIAVGKVRVEKSKGGEPAVLEANRFALAGSRDARTIVRSALRQLNKAPCLDQWMNSDPEYFRAAAKRRSR